MSDRKKFMYPLLGLYKIIFIVSGYVLHLTVWSKTKWPSSIDVFRLSYVCQKTFGFVLTTGLR